jgi:hypothetical protein
MIEIAKSIVADHLNKSLHEVTIEDIHIVWFSKTLQNWKALLFTPKVAWYYYEVTYNGNKLEVYLDSYMKTDNKVISLADD